MRVLVSGATGFVGKRLVRAILERGDEVTAVSRSAERARAAVGLPCRFVSWDAVAEPIPEEALRDCDAVVHLAGEGVADERWTAKRKKKLYDSRILGSRNLMHGVEKMRTPRPKVVVSASAIGFYGDRGDEILTEDSAGADDFLAKICRDWEAEIQKPALPDVRRVSVRIGIVLGAESGILAKLVPMFRSGLGGPVSDGKQWMSWIHVDDLVKLILHCVDTVEIKSVVNGVGPAPVTNETFSKTLAEILNKPAFVQAPAMGIKLLMGEMAVLALASQRVLPTRALASGFKFKFNELKIALSEECDGKKKPYKTLEVEQWVPLPVEKVFPFFAEARNLETLTPPWLNFRVKKVSTEKIGAGTLIDYRLKVHGFPIGWRTLIESWDENRSFVDTQLHGPYSLWHHTHEFRPFAGGTLMKDTIRYRVPMGAVGKLLAGWLVSRDVRTIFGFRAKKVIELFGSADVA